MINVAMTIREMVSIASNGSCNGDLYERIVKALEVATGNQKLMVACNGVVYSSQYWDQKITAIKALRKATRWELKQAKDWVEDCQHTTVKTFYTPSLDPTIANELCNELKNCGMNCWTVDG